MGKVRGGGVMRDGSLAVHSMEELSGNGRSFVPMAAAEDSRNPQTCTKESKPH